MLTSGHDHGKIQEVRVCPLNGGRATRLAEGARGIALVAALGMVAVLLLLAVALSSRIISYSRSAGYSAGKTAEYYASVSGVEMAREYLGRTYTTAGFSATHPSKPVSSGPYNDGGDNYLSFYLDKDGDSATRSCSPLTGTAIEENYYRPLGVAGSTVNPLIYDEGGAPFPTTLNNVPFQVFIKDDRDEAVDVDGDGNPDCSDYETDNNGQVWLMAQATGAARTVTLEGMATYGGGRVKMSDHGNYRADWWSSGAEKQSAIATLAVTTTY